MKYKKGDDIYLKGRITNVSSCSEVSFPYEVNTADEFIDVREEDIASVNKPEKATLNEEEAEWLDELKAYYRHREDQLYVITRQGWGNDFCFSCHGEQIELSYEPYKWKEDIESVKRRLVNAILYGYEIKKDKLYTVFQVATEEYLYTNGAGKLSSAKVSYAFVEESEEYHFTQQKLEELNYWENPAFEIKEVKK